MRGLVEIWPERRAVQLLPPFKRATPLTLLPREGMIHVLSISGFVKVTRGIDRAEEVKEKVLRLFGRFGVVAFNLAGPGQK